MLGVYLCFRENAVVIRMIKPTTRSRYPYNVMGSTSTIWTPRSGAGHVIRMRSEINDTTWQIIPDSYEWFNYLISWIQERSGLYVMVFYDTANFNGISDQWESITERCPCYDDAECDSKAASVLYDLSKEMICVCINDLLSTNHSTKTEKLGTRTTVVWYVQTLHWLGCTRSGEISSRPSPSGFARVAKFRGHAGILVIKRYRLWVCHYCLPNRVLREEPARRFVPVDKESDWSFAQILLLLMLILPVFWCLLNGLFIWNFLVQSPCCSFSLDCNWCEFQGRQIHLVLRADRLILKLEAFVLVLRDLDHPAILQSCYLEEIVRSPCFDHRILGSLMGVRQI